MKIDCAQFFFCFCPNIIHVYNFSLSDALFYGILEYRKYYYIEKKASLTVDVDIFSDVCAFFP